MSKKMMLLALSVVGTAMFALPAVASATPAHIDQAETFTITSGSVAVLETTTGEIIACHNGVSGHGSVETTTTGNITLDFTGCTTKTIFGTVACTTHPPGGSGPSETIATTALPFHLINISSHSPGVLITPNAATGVFAHFTCAGINKTVTGNGVIGTITSPTCGVANTTASLAFEQSPSTGLQTHTTYTGVSYHLMSGGNKAAQSGFGTIHFNNPRTISCT